ncbi:MAG TPA: STAS domain-containing protein [Gammaproteobacteria bacterium]|nr:STAS domain-containing protein [Gammaproteobacteria bacterium]
MKKLDLGQFCKRGSFNDLMGEVRGLANGKDDIAVDFSAVDKPDLRCVQLLASLKKTIEPSGAKMSYEGVSPGLRDYFVLTGIGEVLGVEA